MLGSVLGYFFSIITVFAAVMTFMSVLIGLFDNSTFEKLRHYPHPRPVIERTVAPAPPNKELAHMPNPEPHRTLFALGTIEAAAPTDLSRDKNTKDSRVAAVAKTDAEKRKEQKIKPGGAAHLRQPAVLARQRQNYEGHGYATALGHGEGRSALEDLNGQR